jgi:hypothetical protein
MSGELSALVKLIKPLLLLLLLLLFSSYFIKMLESNYHVLTVVSLGKSCLIRSDLYYSLEISFWSK